jgi:hypothetical protein
MGNEKVASNVYYELKEKGTIHIADMDSYLSLDNEAFVEAWRKGSLSDYVLYCRWDKDANTYTITPE